MFSRSIPLKNLDMNSILFATAHVLPIKTEMNFSEKKNEKKNDLLQCVVDVRNFWQESFRVAQFLFQSLINCNLLQLVIFK